MVTLLDEKRDLLCRAIAEKRLVQFKYDGRSRIVEPFCCGTGRAGNLLLKGFQIRGSEKTKPLCWRVYELSDMSQLSVTQHGFTGKRDDFVAGDKAIDRVLCSI